jgi:solute carrier family 25 protein 38
VRLGPSELLRGFLASSLRDAPYAGLFVVLYESIKREACTTLLLFQVFFINQSYPLTYVSIGLASDIEQPIDSHS